MAHKLAIEAPPTFPLRAIVPVVTSLVETNLPRPGSLKPAVLQILGVEDKLIPIGGGQGVAGHVFLSGDDSARAWAEHNGAPCGPC